jgi:uncharacterized protein GlcG (DUF336 family)
MADIVTTHRLSEGAVLKMLKVSIEKARELRTPVGVGIVDAGGHLRAWVLMDGAPPFAFDSVVKKARTAAYIGQPSGQLPADIGMNLAVSIPDFSNLPGGFPIVMNAEILGGIAAGGGPVELDIAIAKAGIAAIQAD